MRKFARTISGVTPLAVMTLPMSCPGRCLYCPTYPDAPQSYTPESPAVLRARTCDYDARQQVELRLRIFTEMGHPTDKIELIIMGGTFLAYPVDYQYRFILKVQGNRIHLRTFAFHSCNSLCCTKLYSLIIYINLSYFSTHNIINKLYM